MKKFEYFLISVIIMCIMILSGCEPAPGSPAYKAALRHPEEQSAGAPASSAALGDNFKQTVTVPDGKALIYFYRLPGQTGFAAISNNDAPPPFGIKANGKTIVTLIRGGYYAYVTDPGRIEFTTFEVGFMAPGSTFSITVDAKAKQAYYIKGIHGKGLGGRARLDAVSPETGASEMVNCKLITQQQ